jgi:hypothetical protein
MQHSHQYVWHVYLLVRILITPVSDKPDDYIHILRKETHLTHSNKYRLLLLLKIKINVTVKLRR